MLVRERGSQGTSAFILAGVPSGTWESSGDGGRRLLRARPPGGRPFHVKHSRTRPG